MRKIIYIFIALSISLSIFAQGQGLQIAPKGGLTQWMGKDVHGRIAPTAGLDLSYIVRWHVGRETQIGFRTGLGVSYASCTLTADMHDCYERVDYYSNTIEYTNSASAQEQHKQLLLEIPVLLAFQTHGFAIHVGPKLLWTAYNPYNQTVNEAHIVAYYPRYGVPVPDEMPTGRLITPYTHTGTKGLPTLTLALSGEIGYEWQLGNRYSHFAEHYIGLQLYADYGLKNLALPNQEAFLSVAPITAAHQTPPVTVGVIAGSTPLHYLNVGLRLYYTIQSVDYSARGWHR